MIPEWRPIPDWPYEISNLGEVRRLGKLQPLVARPDKDGYIIVHLCKNGKAQTFKSHRLVCLVFNGPPLSSNHTECQHKNGIRSDNFPSNLKWGTPKDNAMDRDVHGNTQKGEIHSRAVLTRQQVDSLRKEYSLSKVGRIRIKRGSRALLAQKYNITVDTLATIVSGRGYK